MSEAARNLVTNWDKFWRQQAARGKLKRYKKADLVYCVDEVYQFFLEYGFDTDGVHLFTEKTHEVHKYCMDLLAEGALDDPESLPYVNTGTEDNPIWRKLSNQGKIEGHHTQLPKILSTGIYFLFFSFFLFF